MLDLKSNLVLKILQKECRNGGYKIIDKSDIISAMPAKQRVDEDGLENIITILENNECVHVKYDDEQVYCLCVLPASEKINAEYEKQKKQKPTFWVFAIICLFFSLIGGLVGAIIAKFINF